MEIADECAICWDFLNLETSCKLDCGHTFCKDCIVGWIKKKTCPMCRKNLFFTKRVERQTEKIWDMNTRDSMSTIIFSLATHFAFSKFMCVCGKNF